MEPFSRKSFVPRLLATGVGSLPHQDARRAFALITRTLPRTPFWPQLPKSSFLESMNVQISPGLPFLKIEEKTGDVQFDAGRDQAGELERVYQDYLSDNAEAYALPPRYAGGFYGLMDTLKKSSATLEFFKGQMVGPITYGLALQDREKKNLVHNEVVFDGIFKGLILRGRWIIRTMKTVCPRVILFLDEPGLSGYGSAFFSVDAETISGKLNEAIEDFQSQGAVVGIHCCGNTDWPLLLGTKADVINFDAWSFLERFSLYKEAVVDFLSRKGILAWGIVPTSEFTGKETLGILQEKMERGIRELSGIIPEEVVRERSLLTSSCGMGLMTVEDAEKATALVSQLSDSLREKYFQ